MTSRARGGGGDPRARRGRAIMPTTTPVAPAEAVGLEFNGKSLTLPLIEGSEAEAGIDISQLRAKSGLITLDPGFGNSGACRSAITFIDGEKGVLRYRGYDIADLAAKSTFLEVAWLLLRGELPTRADLEGFRHEVTRHSMLHEDFRRFFGGLPKDAHPMPVCSAAVGALATFYQQPETDQHIQDTVTRLIAKMPTIAACSYKHSIGQPFMYPKNALDYSSNFLHMMFATPCESYEVDPVLARAIDLLLILHADHEQNCSTSTVRVVGSSRANLFASIAAGISALWGPLHGGANQQVIEMLDQIEADGGDVQKFVNRAKDKRDNSRLMGFGHRVYKNYDPRAAILKRACMDVLEKLGVKSRQLEIAMELEATALNDEYFISHKLYPNVDFYSGIIYRALGIPVNMFTVMFTLGRLPGWIAHWLEMRSDPETRIVRPRQIYTGPTRRAYVPMESRV
jgi:citrate synthase